LEHDIGVGGVGARGDGCNHDGSVVKLEVLTLIVDLYRFLGLVLLESITLEADLGGESASEVILKVGHVHSIVRSLGTRERWLDAIELKVDDVSRVNGVRLRSVVFDEHSLLTEIALDHLNVALISAGETEIVDGLLIDGEVSHGSSILRGHVGNGGSISKSQVLDTRSIELDELANNTSLSEHLDAGEDEIGGSGVFGQVTRESETDNLRKDHGDVLTEHD